MEYRLGLTGFPLAHSLSPMIHYAALKNCNLSGEYRLYPIPSNEEGKQPLSMLFQELRSGGLQGLNVTIPHKQTVLTYIDWLTPAARAIGAVNTVLVEGSLLVGENTDAPGFLADLKRLGYTGLITRAADQPERGSALVLGAGGSARAVVYALASQGWEVNIAARRMEQAIELVESLRTAVFPANLNALRLDPAAISDVIQGISLIVNTTPVGMVPHPEGCPWPEDLDFPRSASIYDLVYNPRETRLICKARQEGLRAENGLGMLVEQAALAFELWTGHSPDRNYLFNSVLKES
jgi:shikimate dehydrogenase